MPLLTSFPPVINNSSRILILGSMPGRESLARQQYYANNRNHFWRIIYGIFDLEVDPIYENRIRFVLSKKIALWDVLKSCTREGSLDSGIMNEETNNFTVLFDDYPGIKYVLFNGAKAYNSFSKHVGFGREDLIYRRMPSTSPAHTVKFEEKMKEWLIIRKYLETSRI